jgi:hypothetical protein
VKALFAARVEITIPLFAAISRVGSQWLLLLSAVALVALTIAALYFWTRLRKPRGGGAGASSEDLFAELCEEHGLNRLERALLLQVASTYELPQPAILFVDPWTLEQAAAAPGPEAHRYGSLRQRLFASLN